MRADGTPRALRADEFRRSRGRVAMQNVLGCVQVLRVPMNSFNESAPGV